MNELIQLQALQIQALQNRVSYLENLDSNLIIKELQTRNIYLENELHQAKNILEDIVKDWEVFQEEEVKPNVLDNMFDNPIMQLNKLF